MVKDKWWKAAVELVAGDVLVTSDGEDEIVKSIKVEEKGYPVTTYNLTVEDNHTFFVSDKGVLTHNMNNVQEVRNFATEENAEVIVVSARAEEEIAELDEEDKAEFLEALGIEESGLDQLIRAAYDLLGLATYFTAGEQEVRAWTFKKGIKAPQAAGIIHSDFERGFIRAETVSFEDLDHYGNMHAAKEAGRVRLEGKDYVVQDGDVMLFRFNV